MTVLALEFSSAQRSVAVLHANLRRDELHESLTSSMPAKEGARVTRPSAGGVCEAVEAGAGGTGAFRLIEKALAGAGLAREQIEVIAVGLGPGSYTGIRVAISIAQGWQLARGIKLLGISSADGLAAQAQAENIFGRVNVVMDAQRNEFYLASYETSARGWEEARPLRIVSLAEMLALAGSGEIWVGPEVTRWFPKGKILFPSAVTSGRLARGRNDFVSGDKLAPIYLRETSFVKATPPRRF
ncbi:MAG TPA: tRNA (adenosine(37)-N6)-threonylcarbamoyltransferase complex dimerization subunit type 1 TsaB [Verrucomicrobiae bacterium]|nr:tRNA (adenosine(37)-N6)-threonylcarbamoyltransferase complex dimerization subunit type 1 TsaB [Verrucomicrobiae bacterium]